MHPYDFVFKFFNTTHSTLRFSFSQFLSTMPQPYWILTYHQSKYFNAHFTQELFQITKLILYYLIIVAAEASINLNFVSRHFCFLAVPGNKTVPHQPSHPIPSLSLSSHRSLSLYLSFFLSLSSFHTDKSHSLNSFFFSIHFFSHNMSKPQTSNLLHFRL